MSKAAMLVVCAALWGVPAFAQVDFSGEWAPLYHEDGPERLPGPELGDYTELPINDAARLRADSWDADRISVVEQYQCRPHGSDYSMRGLGNMRVWREIDPATQRLVGFHTHMLAWDSERTLYMDGRPHPPEYANHTWQGFSTAKWEGNMLTVTTTHLKENYMRRNGVPRSDKAEITEFIYRRGQFLTWTVIINDPIYLTEPMIRTSDFRTAPTQELEGYSCEVVTEVDKPHGWVPHWLPGTNPFLDEYAKQRHVPVEASSGGPETMLPEYRKKVARP